MASHGEPGRGGESGDEDIARLEATADSKGGRAGATTRGDAPPASGMLLSEMLLAGRNEVQILHNGDIYRLRRTKSGKLILHK